MTIFIFGNPDLKIDSLPIKILPELKKQLPEIRFKIQDPNEEWEIPDDLIVIDTVLGIDKVTIFSDLKQFEQAPRNTLHDFDALSNLRYLKKLGKLKKIKIIGLPAGRHGIPPTIDEKKAIEEISAILKHLTTF